MIAESKAIEKLSELREEFRAAVKTYEMKARPCEDCAEPGVCCRDVHFVNVRVTRLEAAAIKNVVRSMDERLRLAVRDRAVDAVGRFGLEDGSQDAAKKTYACPLFEPGVGCLVHRTAKPLPCIAHACYSSRSDLPPAKLCEEKEAEVARLNRRAYGRDEVPQPIPIVLRNI